MALSASKSRGWWALGASIALHLTLTQAASSAAGRHPLPQPRPVSPDAWTGTTFDVDAVLQAPSPTTDQAGSSAPKPATEPKAPSSALAVSDAQPDRTARNAAGVGHVPRKPARAPPLPAPVGNAGSVETQGSADTAADAGRALSAAPAQSYGASGEASRERNLAKAFTRVLPRATNSDSVWDSLPIGYSARIYARLQTNAEGHVVATDSWLEDDAAAPAPELQRLVQRGAGLLGTGQFALPNGVGAGTQTLRIDVVLKQGSRSDDLLADPRDTVQLGFDPPSPGRPGRAFFRKASGRTLEMRVTILSK